VITVVAFCSSVLVFLSLPLSNTFDVHWSVVSRKGTEIISYAFNDFGRQIWMIPTNPSGGNQIVRKNHAFEVVLSPDGNWFAYFSQKGIFGLRSFSVDLRVARMDGTQDSVLLAGFDRRMSDEDERGARGKEFSPDSKYIALLCDTMIYVVDLEGRIRSQAAILSNSFQDLLGWRPDGTEVLILNHRQKCVQAFNVAKRRFRTIYQAHQRLDRYRLEHTGFGIRYVLDDNVLIDLDKGIAQALPDYIKNAFAVVSPDLNALIYYDWGDYSILGKSSSYVRLFHITTGQDELCAEFRGAIHQPIFSPDGSRIGVERQTESRQIQTVVINRNSIVHTFKDWGLIGWRDSKRIVLADDSNVPKRMALGDIDSGQIHQFYP
jgi:Tol biopolymer transport system component